MSCYSHKSFRCTSHLDELQAATLLVEFGRLHNSRCRRAAITQLFLTYFPQLELVLLPIFDSSYPFSARLPGTTYVSRLPSTRSARVTIRQTDKRPHSPALAAAYVQRSFAMQASPPSDRLPKQVLSLPTEPSLSRNKIADARSSS